MTNSLKNIYRFLKYKQARQKYFRELKLKPIQNKNFELEFKKPTHKIIVFIVPGADAITGKEKISGGAISILSIAEETKKIFLNLNNTETIVCTINNDNILLKYESFENNFNLYSFNQIIKHFKNLHEIIIHLPDFLITPFYQSLSKSNFTFLNKITKVHINLMNQNIKLMPPVNQLNNIKQLTSNITITTAHQQYSTLYYRNYFGFPLHKLSVWISPEQYTFKAKHQKENLLIYSPDEKPEKEKIIAKLKTIEGLKLQMIQGITYTQFKEVISRAKWALTFGEGFDGYILEPILSGTIGFAVYNEDFFTIDFKGLKTIYNSYDELYNKIETDIKELENVDTYTKYQQVQYKICESQYSSKVYQQNIEKFYKGDYTFK